MQELGIQGIAVKPTPITAGDRVKIEYDGLLSQSGAEEIYLHAGYGNAREWRNVQDFRMRKGMEGWETEMNVHTDDRLNICFHDNANNWDNNSGSNWSFEVHNGNLY